MITHNTINTCNHGQACAHDACSISLVVFLLMSDHLDLANHNLKASEYIETTS